MRFVLIISSIVAFASAIDIRFYGESHCADLTFLACTKFGPDSCCWCPVAALWEAVLFVHIPKDWRLMTTSFGAPSQTDEFICQSQWLMHQFPSNGAESVCHGHSFHDNVGYGSARYSFIGTKADDLETHGALGKPCKDVRKVDTFFARTGERYAVSDMEDDLLEELVRCLHETCALIR